MSADRIVGTEDLCSGSVCFAFGPARGRHGGGHGYSGRRSSLRGGQRPGQVGLCKA